MNRFGDVSLRTVATLLLVFIVTGGFALALLNTNEKIRPPDVFLGPAPYYNGAYSFGAAQTSVSTATASLPPTSIVVEHKRGPQSTTATAPPNQPTFNQPGNGSLIEFFSNVTMESLNPSDLASRVVVLAYSVGGYVAYQSSLKDSAYLVVRVPATSYQRVLAQIQTLGNVTSVTSTSNDVTVKYTDLNATLTSLMTEQQALLRLINQSTSVNSTLAIEAQLQNVNAQINSIKSQILQTQRLISYSTITASVSKTAESKPLSMTLSATPKSGAAPLGVTFSAVVSGGRSPYLVNYNFGDGTSQQGQVVIHQFYEPGDYNVTVTVTDSNGDARMASSLIRVTAAPTRIGFGDFGTTLANLFIQVIEGMAEVAVVVALPAALVLGLVVAPLRKRNRAQREPKQS